MFEVKNLCVQSLTWEIDVRFREVRFAKSRVVGSIADQWEAGVRRLHTYLMFSSRLQSKPQLADHELAVGERIFGNDFVVGNGFASFRPGNLSTRFGKN